MIHLQNRNKALKTDVTNYYIQNIQTHIFNMGTTYKLKCHHCGHEFERRYGIGILDRGTLYCNQCGKSKVVDFSCGWDPLPQCECGGIFDAESLGLCPQCQALMKQEDIDPNAPVIAWD